MSDKIVTNFDYLPNEQIDIVQHMRDLAQRIKDSVEERERIDKERAHNPNWKWSAVHICPKEISEIMLDDTTSPEIRYRLIIATYVGHQWVWVGEEPTGD